MESIRLYSYAKVWKVEHKIYSFNNINLPVPIKPFDVLYFGVSMLFVMLVGKFLPFFEHIPTLIRLGAMPYGIMVFMQKKKLDGKNPIKYFFGYIMYFIFEKGKYIERFQIMSDKEVKFKLVWWSSRVCHK
ncbi:TcpE family conjugal transfer membrane protein [Anaeromicropila populeti]|uniref:TcpE family protein n=1 Tax=Anaeromicropila populeti TaxID=37658 RepID=A0A1I6LXD9_9FIRM|nr:TcpE family conjugal transfer membrane protein [Anaeromicropila populeti]SFS08054.1 TcpE family protein [Anaeromicropila populeti]